uniref:Uncharacterized protein n=1 Tax=Aegilops tauschii subsp. strangulata TaxID=200361 RepID=A0A453IZM8_AEGTS
MAVPGGRNGLVEDDDVADQAGAFVAPSDDEEAPLPPHLQALSDAAQNGDVNALRTALDNYGGSIDDPVEDGDTVLHLACLYGHLPCVQVYIFLGLFSHFSPLNGCI